MIKKSLRGIVASDDVPAGSILVVTEALASVQSISNAAFLKTLRNRKMDSVSQAVCKYKVLQSVMMGGAPARVLKYLDSPTGMVDLSTGSLFNSEKLQAKKSSTVNIRALFETKRSIFSTKSTRAAIPPGSVFYGPTSIFNHLCVPNCERAQLGDLMIIYSV